MFPFGRLRLPPPPPLFGSWSVAANAFCDEESAPAILDPRPDLVLDAIDSLNPKVGLLAWCLGAEQPVVSSMGGAGRTDFTRVRPD